MLRNPSSVLKGCASFALLQVHSLSLNIIQMLLLYRELMLYIYIHTHILFSLLSLVDDMHSIM